jgi:hypothetical protein
MLSAENRNFTRRVRWNAALLISMVSGSGLLLDVHALQEIA